MRIGIAFSDRALQRGCVLSGRQHRCSFKSDSIQNRCEVRERSDDARRWRAIVSEYVCNCCSPRATRALDFNPVTNLEAVFERASLAQQHVSLQCRAVTVAAALEHIAGSKGDRDGTPVQQRLGPAVGTHARHPGQTLKPIHVDRSFALDVKGAPEPLVEHAVEIRAEVLDLDPHADGGGDGDGQGARSDIHLPQ